VASPHRVVAAIDFGTHGTGFAWAPVTPENTKLQERRISFFDNWTEQQVNYPKNRSAVLLDANGDLLSWGYRALSQMDAMPKDAAWRLRVGFKMLLGGAGTVTGNGAAAAGGGAGVTLAADPTDAYRLTVLCLEQVVAVAKDKIMESGYEEGDIRWCLTVPAMWDQYTRHRMYEAAVTAGLPDDPDRLLLAKEPDAAALYCAAKGETLLQTPGTRFMVVDAGGGTVDITSHQVASDGRLNELAPPKGAPTGSDFINRAFLEKVLAGQFGSATIGRMLKEHRSAVAGTLDAWERAKRAFSPAHPDLVIPLSAQFYAALIEEREAGRWRPAGPPPTEVIASRDMAAALFDKSIDETMVQVEQELAEMRSLSGVTGGELVLLVGGFAESPYLRAKLSERLAAHGIARVIVPDQPSVAVLAGAVHYAYDPSVFRSWRAPFTLGIATARPFEPGIDPEGSRRESFDGQQVCVGRFGVFVANRAALLTDTPVIRSYPPLSAGLTSVTLRVFATDRADPRYVTDPGVRSVAEVLIDLSGSKELPARDRRIEVAMYFGQTHVRVEARDKVTNQPYTAQIDWKPTW
jgi:molecular chaperone DnaK (HSP70)